MLKNKIDLIPPRAKKRKNKPKKKEIGEYFDFPCRKCGEKKVKMYVYGFIDDSSVLSPREIPAGCVIGDDSPKWHCDNCGLDSGRVDY